MINKVEKPYVVNEKKKKESGKKNTRRVIWEFHNKNNNDKTHAKRHFQYMLASNNVSY